MCINISSLAATKTINYTESDLLCPSSFSFYLSISFSVLRPAPVPPHIAETCSSFVPLCWDLLQRIPTLLRPAPALFPVLRPAPVHSTFAETCSSIVPVLRPAPVHPPSAETCSSTSTYCWDLLQQFQRPWDLLQEHIQSLRLAIDIDSWPRFNSELSPITFHSDFDINPILWWFYYLRLPRIDLGC
jgi:hypothetical protein